MIKHPYIGKQVDKATSTRPVSCTVTVSLAAPPFSSRESLCVQAGLSQEMRADVSLFVVSPDTPGFVMRPAGPGAALPLLLAFDYVNDQFFGKLIAFAQCAEVPGSDGPMTLPVYTMPTVLASGCLLVSCTVVHGYGPE